MSGIVLEFVLRRRPLGGPVGRPYAEHGNIHGFRSDEDMLDPIAKPLPYGVEGHRVVTRTFRRDVAA